MCVEKSVIYSTTFPEHTDEDTERDTNADFQPCCRELSLEGAKSQHLHLRVPSVCQWVRCGHVRCSKKLPRVLRFPYRCRDYISIVDLSSYWKPPAGKPRAGCLKETVVLTTGDNT